MEQIGPRLRSWASILDPATREQAVATSRTAVHLPARRADARRPPRQGRDRRLRHPHARGDHPRRRRGRHRLRDDRGPHPAHRGDDLAGRPAGRAASAIEDAVPLSAGRYNTAVTGTTRRERIADLEDAGGRAPVSTRRATPRTGGCSSARSAPATTSSRSAVDEEDRVWLFLHSGSRGVGNKIAQHHIAVAQRLCPAVVDQPARPGPGLPRRGHGRVRGVHARPAVGAALRAAQPGGDDGPRRGLRRRTGSAAVVEPDETDQLPPQLHRAERHFGKDVWVSRKGAIDAAARACPGSSRARWAPRPTSWCGKGNRAVAETPHRTARAGSTRRSRRAPRVHPRRPARGDGRHRVPRHRRVRRRDPGGVQGHRPVMADAADLVEVRHTLRQIVNVKGD